jgi:uncharacterized Zn-finger protein
MSLAEQAQKAAQQQAAQSQKVAKAVVEKNREATHAWVCAQTGMNAEPLAERDLAVGEYHGEVPVCITRSYPCYALDDVILAFDRSTRELYLVCTDSEHGDYMGPRVLLPLAGKYTKPQRKKRLTEAVGTALNIAAPHPIKVLQEAETTCPTCGRRW